MPAESVANNVTVVNQGIADKLWFNAIWFQSLWFSTVIGRDDLLPLSLALLALHLWLTREDRSELRQMTLVGALGITTDSVLSAVGVYEFAGGVLMPLWLCCLWAGFASALGRSLGWLAGRPLLSIVAGLLVFPLNYWAGQRLGAVEFGYSLPITLAVLAVVWAVMLPLMVYLTANLGARARLEG